MTYRADAVTQRDGFQLQNSNCRMASAAMGIDYHTAGEQTSTGKDMRRWSGESSGGTTSDDAARAWAHYGQTLRIRDGRTWDDARADLKAGRLVMLDVWAAAAGGPCSTGNVGHTIAVAPETRKNGDSTQWLVGDPWCNPPRWSWWNESKLIKGSQEWGRRCGRALATAGYPSDVRLSDVPRPVLMAVVKFLMTLRTPSLDDPPGDPGETEGPGDQQILFTTTKVPAAPSAGGADVAINATPKKITSSSVCKVSKGQSFYRDPKLTDKLTTFTSAREVPYLGLPLDADGKSRAVLHTTGSPYSDKQARPTIVYVAKDTPTGDAPEPPVPPIPPSEDCAAQLAARDAEWQAWLKAAPGLNEMKAWLELAPATPAGTSGDDTGLSYLAQRVQEDTMSEDTEHRTIETEEVTERVPGTPIRDEDGEAEAEVTETTETTEVTETPSDPEV